MVTLSGHRTCAKIFLKGGSIGGKGKIKQEDYCEWYQAMDGKEASRMHNCHIPQQDGESWVINVHNSIIVADPGSSTATSVKPYLIENSFCSPVSSEPGFEQFFRAKLCHTSSRGE